MEKIFVTRSSMPPYEEYIEMIKSLWDSHWLTNMGSFHQKLEKELQEYLEVDNVSLMVNGHMSLELAIQAMDFPRGSEIITTPFTFISTTHAIIRNGLEPVFCDIKMSDYTIDESKIEELITEKTVAIIPVHVYGQICNIEEIERVAYKYNLKVIYDAAHAFGETYKGQNISAFGDASVFSFHATKVFNTIEGGAVCTRNRELYDRIYNLKNFGIRSEELVVSVGANAKMNEFAAVMGLLNLKYLHREIEKRRKIQELYRKFLKEIDGVRILPEKKDVVYNGAYFPLLFEKQDEKYSRDIVYEQLKKENIYARKYFYPLTADQACFKNKYKNVSLECARYCSQNILVLPVYADLKEDDVLKICKIIKMVYEGGADEKWTKC